MTAGRQQGLSADGGTDNVPAGFQRSTAHGSPPVRSRARRCGQAARPVSASAGSHVVTARLAAVDAEIERLTRLRGRPAQATGRA
ncbi:hypothetical protein AB0H51_01325 [Streptomyces griseoluteus]|uniref:hypothetical protein n=1 Tax=Streptomyces griseoluteus TaxID=29306 RepID=UPI0033DEA1E2